MYNSLFCFLEPPLRHWASLVPRSSSLTSLQLLHVPATNTHIPLILIHAVGERLDIVGTRTGRSVGRGLSVSVVQIVVWLGVGIDGLLLGLRLIVGLRGRPAAEHAADGVADGGTYCHTAVVGRHLLANIHCFLVHCHLKISRNQKTRLIGDTHAAVLAI
jgi:hypothetical protein